jgi:hypothetical protein
MDHEVPFDLVLAHRYFSANCFNQTWALMGKKDRTSADDEQMLLLSLASLWHWTQRADCKPHNLSVGNYLVSRVYAALGDAGNAGLYAAKSLLLSEGDEPFCVGAAHEAVARAAYLAGNEAEAARHMAEARRLAELVTDAEDRALLEEDLASIR